MAQELIQDGKLNRQAAADALRDFLENIVRAAGFQLKVTVSVAAERVQTSKQPFQLNPMTSRERRIVHLALKDMPGVRTESVGVGEHRQVVIHPADSKPSR